MDDYFDGIIDQLDHRGQLLLQKIPAGLSREFQLLSSNCRNKIGELLKQLRKLANTTESQKNEFQSERLRELRRIIRDLDFLENVGISALARKQDDDIWLNKLAQDIVEEIHYPLVTPVVTSLSHNYFLIYTELKLLCVPLVEGHFLLHLPDLYHELAHPFIIEEDPRLEEFQSGFEKALDSIFRYISLEVHKEQQRTNLRRKKNYLNQWSRNWGNWLIELFCDLFALYTVGPAFAWSHLHLATKMGEDSFYVPKNGRSSHPPDNARMQVLLHGLRLINFTEKADEINEKWQTLVSILGYKTDPDYQLCFPDHILKEIAEKALIGVKSMGCKIVEPKFQGLAAVFNEAWGYFWTDPTNYSAWEKEMVRKLRKS